MTKSERKQRVIALTDMVKTFEEVGAPTPHPVCVRTYEVMCNSIHSCIAILGAAEVTDG